MNAENETDIEEPETPPATNWILSHPYWAGISGLVGAIGLVIAVFQLVSTSPNNEIDPLLIVKRDDAFTNVRTICRQWDIVHRVIAQLTAQITALEQEAKNASAQGDLNRVKQIRGGRLASLSKRNKSLLVWHSELLRKGTEAVADYRYLSAKTKELPREIPCEFRDWE